MTKCKARHDSVTIEQEPSLNLTQVLSKSSSPQDGGVESAAHAGLESSMKRVTVFVRDEYGAVTVDWVVLTAGIVGLAVTAALLAEDGILGVAAEILAQLSSIGS